MKAVLLSHHLSPKPHPRNFTFLSFVLGAMLAYGLLPAWALTDTTTKLTITSGDSPVTTVSPHTAITLTATVKAGSNVLKQGQVKFCVLASSCQDINVVGLSQLTAAGTATFKFVAGPGTHSYKAVFVGTNAAAVSASPVSSVTVSSSGGYMSKTTFASTGKEGSYTLRADVRGVGTAELPTGTVYFQDRTDSSAELAKAHLSSGLKELSWSEFQFGKHRNDGNDPLVTGDFNDDGHADLVRVGGSYGVTLLLNDGEGHFKKTKLSTESPYNNGYVTAVGDFNNDGKPDIVLTPSQAKLEILLGKGDGTFTRVHDSGVSLDEPFYLAEADFNHDGNADLAISEIYTGLGIQVYLGNGNGTFKAPIHTASKYNSPLIAGDFDGDGRVDLILQDSNAKSGGIVVLFGNGDGTFAKEVKTAQGNINSLNAADVNGDGRTDLVVTQRFDPHTNGSLFTLLGNANRTFSRVQPLSPPEEYLYSFNRRRDGVLGDFNGDGIVDLIFNAGDATHPMTAFLGDGKGSFSLAAVTDIPSTTVPSGQYPEFNVAADFNEDGTPDIASPSDAELQTTLYSIFFTQRNLSVAASGKAPQGAGSHEVVARYDGDANFASSVSMPVTLTGLTGSAPVATLSALALPFGDSVLGSPSNAKTVIMKNTGTAALAITGLTLSPVSGSGLSFATSNDCPASLSVGAACKIRFRFNPGSSGSKVTQFTITDNAGNSPQIITLTGTGVAP